jgi:hypothetical protein
VERAFEPRKGIFSVHNEQTGSGDIQLRMLYVLQIYLYLKMVLRPKRVAVQVIINSKEPTIVKLRRRNIPSPMT